MVIMALNLLVPPISLSMISKSSMTKMISTPSETDRFLSKRGKNCGFKEATKKREFWLFLFTFSIIVGIARMVDENATIIALHNSNKASNNQRTFQIFEIIGAFTTGVFLSLFRIYVSPYALLMINAFFLVASQILMFFIDVSSLALLLAVIIVAFVSGSSFVLAGQIAHEDYGTKHYSKILGIFLTGAAAGIFIFEELVFDQMYYWFSSQESNQNYRVYGKWNQHIFLVSVLSSALAFIMAIGAYLKTRKSDGNKDKVSDFVNF